MGAALLAGVVVALIVLLVLLRRRRAPALADKGDGTGLVLLEFGRAFPGVAVRDVVLTSDGADAFLRLADGRTGFLHSTGRHSLAHIVQPGQFDVGTPVDDRTLAISFRDQAHRGGRLTFASSADAAEVLLWLCGSLTPANSTSAIGKSN